MQGKEEAETREMASLTKMMTCYLVCRICDEFCISLEKSYVEISKFASVQIGTSAQLAVGSFVSIKDVLHGLMMPSGNDAAIVLAENFGMLLYYAALKKRGKFLKEQKEI